MHEFTAKVAARNLFRLLAGRCLECGLEKIADGNVNTALGLRHDALLMGVVLK